MKTALLTLAALLAPEIASAAGQHTGGHGTDHGRTNGRAMAIGATAVVAPTRTVEIVMNEDYDADSVYVFDKKELVFAAGETVRLHIVNAGEEVHEFVMDTAAANAEHKEMMVKSPEMAHDDPNSVRLGPGEEAEILWTFGAPGSFEFACLLPGHYEAGMHGPLTVD
ncbi:cupredoxin domain-containing protein [Salipiger sp.]|uniref:cupredoxin domain-containing protein n=1 Tax=Salipiger sp. TaxID=2078585 RepID=UPI003A97E5ED